MLLTKRALFRMEMSRFDAVGELIYSKCTSILHYYILDLSLLDCGSPWYKSQGLPNLHWLLSQSCTVVCFIGFPSTVTPKKSAWCFYSTIKVQSLGWIRICNIDCLEDQLSLVCFTHKVTLCRFVFRLRSYCMCHGISCHISCHKTEWNL